MFPLVPYHNLPKLHELVKPDMPTPYASLWNAWKEIIPAVLRQVKDPGYCVKRRLPTPTLPGEAPATSRIFTAKGIAKEGWLEVCASGFLKPEDAIRFDHEQRTYALYRTAEGALYATDGICTHGNTHLADGLVKGTLIECPKHNGRFDLRDGSPQRAPVCVALKTYKVREHDNKIFIQLTPATEDKTPTYHLRVISNRNVATFIKELVLEPMPGSGLPEYQPGDYMQLEIPAYGSIAFEDLSVEEPFAQVWRAQHLFEHRAENNLTTRRNYSLATNPGKDKQLRFNVRIAMPPRGQDCLAGTGSSYIHKLQPGDTVTATGPFGSFHIKESEKEMVYIGGGAGMAPLRSHLSHLLETKKSARRISYWYGARSSQEIFYQEYFEQLTKEHPNFSFHLALSEPQPEDHWNGQTGFIHQVLKEEYLSKHQNPTNVEYYLCGPPVMVKAATEMLQSLGVPSEQISFDEF